MPRLAAARRRFHFIEPVLSIGRRLGFARSPRRPRHGWRGRGYTEQSWPSRSALATPGSRTGSFRPDIAATRRNAAAHAVSASPTTLADTGRRPRPRLGGTHRPWTARV